MEPTISYRRKSLYVAGSSNKGKLHMILLTASNCGLINKIRVSLNFFNFILRLLSREIIMVNTFVHNGKS